MNASAGESTASSVRPLRIWPALVLLAIAAVARLIVLTTSEMSLAVFMLGVFAPLATGLGCMLWWLVASRATARERLIGLPAVLAIAGVCFYLLHFSLKSFGPTLAYFLPSGLLAVGLALVLLYRARPNVRLCGAIAAAIVGFGAWGAVRTDGVLGDFKPEFAARWTPTAEDTLTAEADESLPRAAARENATAFDAPQWPGFRGANRDGRVPGVVLAADWEAAPPKEIWRRRVGPGWSSFAVAGGALFTQEQRGEFELVACYDAETGGSLWTHKSPARFYESTAGAGPRATPTLAGGRLYAVGATGLVHCLDPATGDVIWQRDLTKDAEREPPMWGFSSSPLIVGDVVIVHAGGPGEKGLLAYDCTSGELRWTAAAGESYSSPHRATVGGQDAVLILANGGLAAINPADGASIWTYTIDNANCLQPLVLQPASILLGTGSETRRVELDADTESQFKQTWTSRDMKPTFNDYVAHRGALFGFDGNIFACVDLETGKRHWKKGRYGNGQVLLLPDADQLLVTSETGDVVLLQASSNGLEELARHKALSGKTWNHPALVGNRLYLRNGEEAVCLELPLAEAASAPSAE